MKRLALILVLAACSPDTDTASKLQQEPAVLDAAARANLETLSQKPVTVQFGDSYNALAPQQGLKVSLEAPGFDPADAYWGLPEGEGRETVAGLCSACHSLRIVMSQRATAARWDSMLVWMVEKQGMPALEAGEHARVLAYLTRHFGTQ